MDRILVYDRVYSGHRSLYVSSLIDFWIENKLGNKHELIVSLPQKFFDINNHLIEGENYESNNVKFFPYDKEIRISRFVESNKFIRDWVTLKLIIKSVAPTHCLCLYLDSLLLPLGIYVNMPKIEYSGIYFRPSFHYKHFEGSKAPSKLQLEGWIKKIILKRAINNEGLKYIFSLDRFAVDYINEFSPAPKAIALPEPSNIRSKVIESENLKEELGIDSHRKVFLLFGIIKRKKGIYHLLRAVETLSPRETKQLCILIIGPIESTEKNKILTRINTITQKTDVQIIIKDQYINSNLVQNYFAISDVVLALYLYHVGSSNIVVQASVAGRPVFGTDFGLVGENIRRYKLGIAVDINDVNEVSNGIRFFLDTISEPFDKVLMNRFAKINTKKNFASTIFSNVV